MTWVCQYMEADRLVDKVGSSVGTSATFVLEPVIPMVPVALLSNPQKSCPVCLTLGGPS